MQHVSVWQQNMFLSVVAWNYLALSVWMDCKPGFSQCWLHTAELDLSHSSHNSGKTLWTELPSLRAPACLFWMKKCERGWRRTVTSTMGTQIQNVHNKINEENIWEKPDGGGGKHLQLPRLRVSWDVWYKRQSHCSPVNKYVISMWIGWEFQLLLINDLTFWTQAM